MVELATAVHLKRGVFLSKISHFTAEHVSWAAGCRISSLQIIKKGKTINRTMICRGNEDEPKEAVDVNCSQRNCQSTFRYGLATFSRPYFILAWCVVVIVHVVV